MSVFLAADGVPSSNSRPWQIVLGFSYIYIHIRLQRRSNHEPSNSKPHAPDEATYIAAYIVKQILVKNLTSTAKGAAGTAKSKGVQ